MNRSCDRTNFYHASFKNICKTMEILSMPLKESSKVIVGLSVAELDALQELVLKADAFIQCKFARHLVYRHDAMRLIHLANLGNPELSFVCVRYLKIKGIRKVLLKEIMKEEVFCPLFNDSCNVIKRILLECLTVNKVRDNGWLADRLLDNHSLVLTKEERNTMMSACSLEKYVEVNTNRSRGNKYIRIHHKEIKRICFKKIYSLYLNSTKSYSELCSEMDKYLAYLDNIWEFFEMDGKRIYLFDFVLDVLMKYGDKERIVNTFSSSIARMSVHTMKYGDYSSMGNTIYDRSTLNHMINYIIMLTPIYFMKKTGVMEHFIEFYQSGEEYCSCRLTDLLILTEKCRLCGETDLKELCLRGLCNECHYDMSGYGMNEKMGLLKQWLTKEELQTVINGLIRTVEDAMNAYTSNDNVYYSSNLCMISYLQEHVDCLTNEHYHHICDLLLNHEKAVIDSAPRNAIQYYALLTQEVPLDFAYHLATKSIYTMYPTVYRYESILCLKGNTYINIRDVNQRVTALKQVISFAVRMRDVRALHRALNIYVRTELKSNDITLNLSDLFDAFSPDALGLTETSCRRSGGEEVAKQARKAIEALFMEWANTKKGDIMVKPLMLLVSFLYGYACMYKEYEEEYCEMMKPYVQFLVTDKMQLSNASLSTGFSSVTYRKKIVADAFIQSHRNEHIMNCKDVKNWLLLEHYCAKKVDYYSKGAVKDYGIDLTIDTPCALCPIPEMSYAGLYGVLKCLEEVSDVNWENVFMVMNSIISSAFISNGYTVEKKERVQSIIEHKYIVRKEVMEVESKDFAVLRQLYNDTSIHWKGCIDGLGVIPSVLLVSSLLGDKKKLFIREVPTTSVSYLVEDEKSSAKKVEKKEKEQDKTRRLLVSIPAKNAYLLRNAKSCINSIIEKRLVLVKKESIHICNTMTNLAASVDGLSWCIDTLTSVRLSTLLDVSSLSISSVKESIYAILSDANLLSVFDYVSLLLRITIETILLAISINRSPEPIRQPKIISQLPSLQIYLLNYLSHLVLMNKELIARGIQSEKMYSIRCYSEDLVRIMRNIDEGKVDAIDIMMKEESIKVECLSTEQVTINFADNAKIGRFLEFLLLSRIVKEYFGKSLQGIVSLVNLLNAETSLCIVRRLLMISTFTPQVESILMYMLDSSSNVNHHAEQVLGVMEDNCKNLTVSFIRLIFRVARHRSMNKHGVRINMLMNTIIDDIVTKAFKSVDVYTVILQWVFTSILTKEDVDYESMKSICLRFASLDMKDDAGRTVLNFTMGLTKVFTGIEVYLSHDTCKMVTEIERIYTSAVEKKQKTFQSLVLSMIVAFNVCTYPDSIQSICKVLTKDVITLTDDMLDSYRVIVENMWKLNEYDDTTITSCLCVLIAHNMDMALKAFQKSYGLVKKIASLQQRKMIPDSEEYRALHLDSKYDKELKESHSWNLLSSLSNTNLISLKKKYQFLQQLTVLDEQEDIIRVLSAALLKGLGESKEMKEEDHYESDEDSCSYYSEENTSTEVVSYDWNIVLEELKANMKDYMYCLHRYTSGLPIAKVDTNIGSLYSCFMERHDISIAFLFLLLTKDMYFDDKDKECEDICTWIKENNVRELYSLL